MRKFLMLGAAMCCLVGGSVRAANYSTRATITPEKDPGLYSIQVSVCELLRQHGTNVERVVARPRIQTHQGAPAALSTGPAAGTRSSGGETVRVETSWPYPQESGTAVCTVIVSKGAETVSQSVFELQVLGPGRVPLVLEAKDVVGGSVQVVKQDSDSMVVVRLAGLEEASVRKVVSDNFGNVVQVRSSQGELVSTGRCAGAYEGLGLALACKDEAEAKRLAALLGGEATQHPHSL